MVTLLFLVQGIVDPMYPAWHVAVRDVEVPADGLCQYYCILVAQDPPHWDGLDEVQRREAAQTLRSRCIAHYMSLKDHATYSRLSRSGSDGYLEESEFAVLAAQGGVTFEVELESGTVLGPYGDGPVCLRMVLPGIIR